MTRKDIGMAVFFATALASLASVSPARANFDACGGIFVSGSASCEYRETEQCMTECKSETVQTACAAKLYVSCERECTASASVSCESSCSSGCTTNCTEQAATKQPPNCMGLCVSDCKRDCDRGGPRGACCSHNCNKRCEDKCKASEEAVKPAECTQTCSNACSGSCTAQANYTCQESCQTSVYTECETETIETCETKCMDEGGAIFCDGQFVNATNARSCADELKAKLDIDIDIRAEIGDVADDAVEGVEDTYGKAKKKSKELCSVALVGSGADLGASALLIALGAVTLIARRRRAR